MRADETDGGTSTSFTRSSIAKQLSVLFDDGGSSADNLTLLGQSDAHADDRASTSQSASDEGHISSPFGSIDSKSCGVDITYSSDSIVTAKPSVPTLDGSLRLNVDVTDNLVDQLAAVCCSPPRHETGQRTWRGSPTAAWQ